VHDGTPARTSPSRHREPQAFSRYVAIGDSFTEGMSDADPQRPDAYVGWADRLAAHLARMARENDDDFGYANLAVRGRLLADIAGRQVDNALALGPDLVSIVGGGNDILRPKADIDALAARLEDAVARLRAGGADVLMATPTDPRDAPLIRASRGRAATYTAHIWSIARRHDASVIDLWGMGALRDWRLWGPDRIHMTSEGHRRVALNAFTTLGFTAPDAGWAIPLPAAPPLSRADAARANAQWAREYLGPWVRRRVRGESSGDTISAKRPTLTPLED
jgi:lysophospholipase L1-like esterase